MAKLIDLIMAIFHVSRLENIAEWKKLTSGSTVWDHCTGQQTSHLERELSVKAVWHTDPLPPGTSAMQRENIYYTS